MPLEAIEIRPDSSPYARGAMRGTLGTMRRQWGEYRLFFRGIPDPIPHHGGHPAQRPQALGRTGPLCEAAGPRTADLWRSGRARAPSTGHLVAALAPDDRLDLVELNGNFVHLLEQRFKADPPFQAVADRARLIHGAVEDLPAGSKYHLIISGLPLNNFSVEVVQKILGVLLEALRRRESSLSSSTLPCGRPGPWSAAAANGLACEASARRCAGLLDGAGDPPRLDWANVPPAWVHHVRREV